MCSLISHRKNTWLYQLFLKKEHIQYSDYFGWLIKDPISSGGRGLEDIILVEHKQ